MNVEEAFKKSVEYIKDVLEFLEKVKEKKLRKEKEDLLVALRVFLDKTRSLVYADNSDNASQDDYVDVAQSNDTTGDGLEVYVDTATNQADDGIYDDNEQVVEEYVDVVVDEQESLPGKGSPSKSTAIIPPTPCDQLKDAIIADFLDVKREKSLVKGAWMKRWCVIQRNVVYMYETSKDKKQKYAFEVNGFSVIVRDDITKESKRKDRCFELKNIQTNKVYDFCAMDKASVMLWKQSFEKASLKASSNSRLSVPKVGTLPPSPSHSEKKKTLAGMMSPFKTMMKKSNDQSDRPTCSAGSDVDDVYVDTEGDSQQQLPIYDDTEAVTDKALPKHQVEDEEMYDDVGDTSGQDTSNRTMPRPPKSIPLPATPTSNQRPLPSELNSFSFDGSPQAPPRPSKDNKPITPTAFSPKKTGNKESGSGTIGRSGRLPPTPDKSAAPPLHTLPGNAGKASSNGAPFDQKEDEAKYKDVNVVELYQGMWDCPADDGNELSFKRGQIVHIISKEYDNHGWWIAKRDGDVGLVPREYLMEAYEM